MSSDLSIISYKFPDREAFLAVVNRPDVSTRLKLIEKRYQIISPAEAMQSLSLVGNLLQMAYAGCKGLKSSIDIVGFKADYHTLVTNSSATTSQFVQATFQALYWHEEALDWANKNKPSVALKNLSRCSEEADKMILATEKLITESATLCQRAKDALQSASKDDVLANEKKEEVRKLLADIEAKEERLKSLSKDYEKQVEEERKKEKEAAKKADAARTRAFVLSIVTSLVKPVTVVGSALEKLLSGGGENSHSVSELLKQAISEKTTKGEEYSKTKSEFDKQKKLLEIEENKEPKSEEKINQLKEKVALLEVEVESKKESFQQSEDAIGKIQELLQKESESLQEQEFKAAERRSELQKLKRENDADLAESVKKLEHLGEDSNDLDKVIASLSITLKTLGKVKTIFEKTRLFWLDVKSHCLSLRDIRSIEDYASDSEFQREFIQKIHERAFGWMALGQKLVVADDSIKLVHKSMDQILSNLPSKEEALDLIRTQSQPLLRQLKEESDE